MRIRAYCLGLAAVLVIGRAVTGYAQNGSVETVSGETKQGGEGHVSTVPKKDGFETRFHPGLIDEAMSVDNKRLTTEITAEVMDTSGDDLNDSVTIVLWEVKGEDGNLLHLKEMSAGTFDAARKFAGRLQEKGKLIPGTVIRGTGTHPRDIHTHYHNVATKAASKRLKKKH